MSDLPAGAAAPSDLAHLPELLAQQIDLARLLFRVPTNVIFATDREGRIFLVDGDSEGVFGYRPDELRGQAIKAIIPDRDLERVRDHLRARFSAARGTRPARPLTVYCRRKDGTEVPVEILANPQTFGGTTVLFCAFREIGEVRAARAALGESHELLATLVDAMPALVSAKDAQGRYLLVNAVHADLHGLLADAVAGRTAEELLGERGRAVDELDARLLAEGRALVNHEERVVDAEGRERVLLTSKVPVKDAAGAVKKLVSISLDVTERQWDKERAEALVNFDELTGLPNRGQFQTRLQEAILHADRSGLVVGVIFVDLGRLNEINDAFGYTVGDYALRRAAIRLHTCVRETDTVARLGDDHFAVIQTHLSGFEGAEMMARRIVDSLSEPLGYQGHEIRFDPRCGIAIWPDNGRDARALMQNADLALGRAKAAEQRVQYYLDGMNEEVQKRRELSSGLWRALDQGHFELHFQPQIDIATGRPCGCEALIRWNDPVRGMISPGDFIPLAEESDLIVPIGQWVLKEACRRARDWQDRGLPPVTVAINLSARQFQQADLVEVVEQALADSGIDPRWLELEVTESAAMKDAEAAAATLSRLHAVGVGLAIDDFGTGYSSLAYLRRFPAHKIKLDRAFLRGVPADPNNAAISTAVVQLCHSLNKKVVAEGVEKPEQLDFLRRLRCDEAQGFYFSKPLPAPKFEEWLAGQG
ncbi:MAG TPA: EAL domain-containing protein [Azospirillaceae bacterium]|nr:EAL domain-containing protein [Azospirillaceae bacterium]